jgi:hypothetical protein
MFSGIISPQVLVPGGMCMCVECAMCTCGYNQSIHVGTCMGVGVCGSIHPCRNLHICGIVSMSCLWGRMCVVCVHARAHSRALHAQERQSP